MLAIDDEADALTLLRVVLEAAGARGHDGRLAAARRSSASRTVKPHVLVVDLGMPEMDGFELIAAHPRDRRTPPIRDFPPRR